MNDGLVQLGLESNEAALEERLSAMERAPDARAQVAALVEEITRTSLSDLARAIEESARLVQASVGLGVVRARILAARAHVLCYAGRLDESKSMIQEARDLAATLGTPFHQAAVEHSAIQTLALMGLLGDATRAAETAIASYTRANEAHLAAKVRMNLGILVRMQGQPSAALEHFDAVRAALQADPMARGAVASNRAEALLDLDRFGDAEDAFEEAQEAFTACGNVHAAAIVQGNLGDLLARQGRVSESVLHFELARRSFERAGAHAEVARLGIEEAEALSAIGAASSAADLYRESLPGVEEAGLARESCRAWLGFGRLLSSYGEHAAALERLTRASDAARKTGDALAIAECECLLLGMGESFNWDVFQRATTGLEAHPVRLAGVLLDVSMRRLADGDAVVGLALANQASDAMAQLPMAPTAARIDHARSRSLLQLGRVDEARAAGVRALESAERFRSGIRSLQLSSSVGGVWGEIYELAASLSIASKGEAGIPAAFDAMERRRLRALAQAGGPTPRGEADREQLEQYRTCTGDLAACYSRAEQPLDVEARSSLRSRIDTLEREAERWRHRLAATNAGSLDFADPVSLDDFRATLLPNEARVIFFAEDGHIGAIVVNRRGCVLERAIVEAREIDRRLARLDLVVARWMSGRAGAADEEQIRRSFADLSGVISPHLHGCDSVGILGDSQIEMIPWDLVFDRGHSPRVTLLASATASIVGRNIRGAEVAKLLVIGVSDDRAPGAEAEATAIAGVWRGGQTLIGANATRDAVLGAAREASIVHLASHCVFDREHSLSTRVKLGDGWLTARELGASVREDSMWILGGCETGRVAATKSSLGTGLAMVLLASGARNVVSTLWPLRDSTAVDLFRQLHTSLAAGMSAGDATVGVKKGVRNRGGHPLDWANLVIRGSTI